MIEDRRPGTECLHPKHGGNVDTHTITQTKVQIEVRYAKVRVKGSRTCYDLYLIRGLFMYGLFTYLTTYLITYLIVSLASCVC